MPIILSKCIGEIPSPGLLKVILAAVNFSPFEILQAATNDFLTLVRFFNSVKVGFNAPIYDLLDVNNPEIRSIILDDSPIYNIIKKSEIENILKQHSLVNSVSKFLFNFINSR